MRVILASFAFFALSGSLSLTAATFLVEDNFSAAAVDSSLWTSTTPHSDSSVSQSGGVVVLTNRGILTSNTELPGVHSISGRFQFTGSEFDRFSISTRTDGQIAPNPAEYTNGLRFEFRINRNDSLSEPSAIFIHEHAENAFDAIELATTTVTFSGNEWIDFRIDDDGSSASLYVNDLTSPALSVSSSAGNGNLFGFYNREGAGNGSSISAGSTVEVDYIQVVPEPSISGLISISSLALLFLRRRI